MKIGLSIFFMTGILLQVHSACTMHREEDISNEIKKSEEPEYLEEHTSPLVNCVLNLLASNVYFNHKKSDFESIIVFVNRHDESNTFNVFAYDSWKPEKNYTKSIKAPQYPQAKQIIRIPFEKIAKHMHLEGASATHLKVYKGKDKVFFAVASEKYNKEGVVAVISFNDESPKKASL